MQAAAGPGRTSPFYWSEEVRPGLRVAFTSAGAGNLALHVGNDPDGVRGNRRRLEDDMGIAPGSLRFMSQTHSDRVAVVGGTAGAPDADGMISPHGTEPLAVLVADCVPIVLADASRADGGTGATAVVHAGRAGVGNGIIGSAVRSLRGLGARDLSAWIGPSVCGACYEVPEDMMRAMARTLPEAASRTRAGTPALDLPAAVRCQLEQSSVRVEPVQGASCTLENPALYSHRREPGSGRIAGLVWRA
ncbi:polyphenol oxidase family protein [Arthrobacter sedimenti]|uniref:polyphenol oxidase family protein n=1 Tax=Arthrobacter sedimenti TaxID=2694931 RepID=UPI000B354457|nr:polyphenol oxidase family protein [Arthrobacter sedimenti]OUM42787.1 copper oxidase [Arthrobacter agilis]